MSNTLVKYPQSPSVQQVENKKKTSMAQAVFPRFIDHKSHLVFELDWPILIDAKLNEQEFDSS
jgi:hypothetical protein